MLHLSGFTKAHPVLVRALCCAALAGEPSHRPGSTVGIDLGTTNSAIAILDGGSPSMVPNARGELTTPSVVAYTEDGAVLVGAAAIEQASTNVANTVFSAKRFIGRPWGRGTTQYIAGAGAKVHEGEEGEVLFACPAASEPVSAEEVSAQVLLSLLADAERQTGCRAERAVITVPAYFDDEQRFATMTAARLAGLTSIDLLAEPVAACLAHQLTGATGTVLVFDLGAGTFDVSVLKLGDEGRVEVMATSGDARLGGNDFDALLVEWLAEECSERLADGKVQLTPQLRRQLGDAAEAAKKQLSVVKSVTVPLPATGADGCGSSVDLSRAVLEKLCDPLFRRLREPLYEVALSARLTLPGELDPEYGQVKKKLKSKQRKEAAKLRPEGRQKYLPTGAAVDEIVLVGGGTHMVGVRKLVSNMFAVDPRRTVDPMQVPLCFSCQDPLSRALTACPTCIA